MAKQMPKVVIIGPAYLDMTVKCDKMPEAGETVPGSGFSWTPTGSGVNQAIQAALCGCQVYLIGKISNDTFGQVIKENLEGFGINTSFLYVAEAKTTGVIVTVVNSTGENRSCVSEGANRALRPEEIQSQPVDQVIASADVCLIHGHLPAETVASAIRIAKLHRKKVIFDPPPALASADWPIEYFSVDVLIPNIHEAAEIADVTIDNIHECKMIGSDLVARGVDCVVIKMGKQGCLVVDRRGAEHIPAFTVDLVDQTCSGDAFAGALAASISVGDKIKDAVKFASAAGALACTKFGAQDSLPRKEEIIELLQKQSD